MASAIYQSTTHYSHTHIHTVLVDWCSWICLSRYTHASQLSPNTLAILAYLFYDLTNTGLRAAPCGRTSYFLQRNSYRLVLWADRPNLTRHSVASKSSLDFHKTHPQAPKARTDGIKALFSSKYERDIDFLNYVPLFSHFRTRVEPWPR